jgi:hypothetical protein
VRDDRARHVDDVAAGDDDAHYDSSADEPEDGRP